MSESCIPKAIHESHKMGIELNIYTKKLCDVCVVCHSCACSQPDALLTPCDDISWVFNLVEQ